jgi:predicted amidohydrolase
MGLSWAEQKLSWDYPMNTFRIALANIRFPATPEESVRLAEQAIAQASIERASLICFPECFIPGYRGMGKTVPPPDPAFLDRAWSAIAAAAAKATLAVVLSTERVVDGALLATALVINRDGTIAGFQDKVQLDPSEDGLYSPGCFRHHCGHRPARGALQIRLEFDSLSPPPSSSQPTMRSCRPTYI